jgi:hypothetical protein
MTLEEAQARIAELETDNQKLRSVTFEQFVAALFDERDAAGSRLLDVIQFKERTNARIAELEQELATFQYQMSEPTVGKLFREGEVAAEDAYGPLPDEKVLKTTLAQCSYSDDTKAQYWWWLGYTRYMYRQHSLGTDFAKRVEEQKDSVDKQVDLRTENEQLAARIAELERILADCRLGEALDTEM